MKRSWVIRLEPEGTRPYVALADNGSEAIFVSAEGLVKFLAGGGMEPEAIRAAMRAVHSSESHNRANVQLEDGWG